MAQQGYNYLDRSIQEITSLFGTRIENQKAPAPSPAVKKPPNKKKKGNSKEQKAIYYEDSDKYTSEGEKTSRIKKFCQYHG